MSGTLCRQRPLCKKRHVLHCRPPIGFGLSALIPPASCAIWARFTMLGAHRFRDLRLRQRDDGWSGDAPRTVARGGWSGRNDR
jgi:hypothetical protein